MLQLPTTFQLRFTIQRQLQIVKTTDDISQYNRAQEHTPKSESTETSVTRKSRYLAEKFYRRILLISLCCLKLKFLKDRQRLKMIKLQKHTKRMRNLAKIMRSHLWHCNFAFSISKNTDISPTCQYLRETQVNQNSLIFQKTIS